VEVSPAAGRYEIRNDVTGEVVVAETSGNKTFTLAFGDYAVAFKDLDAYTKPADLPFTLSLQNKTATVSGQYTLPSVTGTVSVDVTPETGKYEIRNDVTGEVVVAETSGDKSFTLQFGDYIVAFKDLVGFTTPANQTFTLSRKTPSVTILGNYNTQIGTGAIRVNVFDQNRRPITDGDWSLQFCDSPIFKRCDIVVANNSQSAALRGLASGTYRVSARLTPNYSGVAILSANPQTLDRRTTLVFDIQYIAKTASTATVSVSANVASAPVSVDGTLIGNASQTVPVTQVVDTTTAHTIHCGDVAGHTTPADIVIGANTLLKDETKAYTCTYSPVQAASTATLSITSTVANAPVSVDGALVGNASPTVAVTKDVTINADHTISCADMPGYVKPADILVAANTLQKGETKTYSCAYSVIPGSNTATLSISANVANAPVSVDTVLVGNASPTVPVTKVVATNAEHTISCGAVAGYTSPAAIVIPANTLQKDETKVYSCAYTLTTLLSVTKEASEVATANNNKLVTYTVTVTNLSDQSVKFKLSDSISATGGKIVANGGELVVVPGTCKVDKNPTSDCLDVKNIDLALDKKDAKHVVTYDMRSNNAAQTAVAAFVNTATATYTNPNTAKEESVVATKSVSVEIPTPVVITGGSSGSSSGNGGGYTMIKGDLKLNFVKMVSLDGINFQDSQKKALAIPENKATRVYTKLTITNPGNVSATNLRLAPFFNSGKSDMTADKVQDVKGAPLDVQGRLWIEKIKSQETVSLSYNVLVHENGKNANPATEGLTVAEIGSTLPINQDGLTYKNRGEQIVTTLYAGQIPALPKVPTVSKTEFTNNSSLLSIRVNSDKSQAAIGDTVNITLTLKNLSDKDLTNLYLTHDTPAELSVVNTNGGRFDGDEIVWKTAILRSGETLIRQFQAKVVGGTPGTLVHSLTQVLVSEAEVSPVDSALMILGGTPSPVAKNYQLAQTGPGGMLTLLILSLLSILAFRFYGKRRDIKAREMALRPL
jgi:uncharacterized repeat protein (TIGR01451 family)